MTDWLESEPDGLDLGERRWPLAPTDLLPRERWLWWEQLWSDVEMLGNRYRLRPANGWWEDGEQVEALAALAAFARFLIDSGCQPPPGRRPPDTPGRR